MNMVSEDLFDDVQVRHTTCAHSQDFKNFWQHGSSFENTVFIFGPGLKLKNDSSETASSSSDQNTAVDPDVVMNPDLTLVVSELRHSLVTMEFAYFRT